MATRGGREMLEIAVKAVWAAMPADVSLLHLLFYIASAGKLDLLLDTEGGAQQDRFVEGAGTLAARVARDARRPAGPVGARCAASSGRPDGVTACTATASRCARSARSSRCRPRLPGASAYDPPLPGLPRPAHPARADGRGDQVLRDLRRAVLARGRSERQRGQRATGPLTLTFDNSPPDGSPGILVGFLEGHWARELGRVSEARAPRRRCSRTSGRLFGPRAARPERLPRQELGRRGVEPRLLRGLHPARAC